jgi:hypothetical protein
MAGRSDGLLLAFFLLMMLPSGHLYAMATTHVLNIEPTPDVIFLINGDQFRGRFVRVVDGTVTFHDDIIGDIHVDWPKIKELLTFTKISVLRKGLVVNKKTPVSDLPSGFLKMSGQQIVLESDDHVTIATIPVTNVEYAVNQTILDKELRGGPGVFEAWNGAITAGATVVQATQDSYNFDESVSLIRTVPTVSWLTSRNRTTILLNGTSGQITQSAYVSSSGTHVPSQVTKTDIYHASVQHDEYFLPHAYYFGIVQYDHSFSQSLQLQQIYGTGLGWTAIRTPQQTLDLTANIQYVKQTFMNAQPGDNKNLIGSTLSVNYVTQLTEEISFTQYVAFLPAFNNGHAYSTVERNTLTLPAYKNIQFVMGTADSYLNSVATTEPPSKRNSFQFTFGLSYNIKSSY